MKKLKHTSSLILSFLILVAFTLASCQKEAINLEHSNHTKIEPELKIVKLTNKDITQNKGITKKLDFFTETLKTRQQNKTIYSSEHDFYINTDFVTYIEKANGSHSYTFAVQYANETGEINNLVLHSQDDGSYNAIYVSYDVTESEKALINNGESVDLEGKVSIALINDAVFIDSLFSKVATTDQCLIPIYSLGACDAGSTYYHDPEPFSDGNGMCSGSQLTLINVSYDMECLNAADTGSPGSDGTSSAGDTGNSNGNPNGGGLNFDPNAPVTTPVTCEGCPEIGEDEECSQEPPQQLINQLIAIFGEANINFDCELNDIDIPEELQFDSLEELTSFFDNVRNSAGEGNVTSTIEDDGNGNETVLSTVVFYDLFFNYNVEVKQQLGVDYQYFTDYSILGVDSEPTGNTSFVDYQHLDLFGHEMDSHQSKVLAKVKVSVPITILGFKANITEIQKFLMVFNATDGSLESKEWLNIWEWD